MRLADPEQLAFMWTMRCFLYKITASGVLAKNRDTEGNKLFLWEQVISLFQQELLESVIIWMGSKYGGSFDYQGGTVKTAEVIFRRQ